MSEPWARVKLPENTEHIFPVNDTQAHEGGFKCWCEPELSHTDTGHDLVIHNSADGRETQERQSLGH